MSPIMAFSTIVLLVAAFVNTTISHSLLRPNTIKEVYCSMIAREDPATCTHGTYKNICENDSCYRGLGDNCDDHAAEVPRYGQCVPYLSCFCGECTGCQNNACILELCNRNGWHNKNAMNFIAHHNNYIPTFA